MTPSRYRQMGCATTLATALWAALAQATAPAAPTSATPPPPRAKLMINVRALPDLESPIVAVLNPGDAVSVGAEQGEFVRLRTAAGTEGYLKHKYLQNYRPTAPVAPPPPPPATLPVEVYRSPYPAEPLVGQPPRAPRSGASPPPTTLLTTGVSSGVQVTVGVGSVISRQSREDLRRDLAREGYGGEVDRLDRAAPGAFLRVGYGLSAPWQAEVALMYLDDLDVHLRSAALTPTTLAQSVADHAPATGFGIAPTLAYRWTTADSALVMRAGGLFALGNETDVRLNGRPLAVDYETHSWLAGLSWETRWDAGMWAGVDLQVMDLNTPTGLLSFTLRWGD